MRFSRTRSRKLLSQFFRRYIALVFTAFLLVSVLLTAVSMRSITRAEITTKANAFAMMTREFERQESYMSDSAHRVIVTSLYHPANLRQNKYRDIELLNHFSQFATATTLTRNAFLMYPDSVTIYRTTGHTSDFWLYIAAAYGIGYQESAALLGAINQTVHNSIMDLGPFGIEDGLFFIYPISFVSSDRYVTARMVFEVSKAALVRTLEQATGGVAMDCCRMTYDGVVIFENGDIPSSGSHKHDKIISGISITSMGKSSYLLMGQVHDGRGVFEGVVTARAFRDAIRDNWKWLAIGILLLTALSLAIAYRSAWQSSRHIRDLAQKYGKHDGTESYNELYQLEDALQRLEDQQHDIVSRAREQMLLQLFKGNADMRMLRRWEEMGIALPYRYSAAYVIDCKHIDHKKTASLANAANLYEGEDAKLYAIPLAGRSIIAVLANFDMPDMAQELQDHLEVLAADYPEAAVFRGEINESLFKLPLSLDEAILQLSDEGKQMNAARDQIRQMIEAFSEQLYFGRKEGATQILREIASLVEKNEEVYHQSEYVRQRLLEEMRHFTLANPEFGWEKRLGNIVLLHDFSSFTAELTSYILSLPAITGNESKNVDERTQQLLAIIDERLSDCDLSLESLADSCSLSRGYVSSLVKTATGKPFKEFLTSQRIHRAMSLLEEQPDAAIQDISVQCGYRTFTNFLRKFKEITGLTPLQYREHILSEHADNPSQPK